MYFAVEDPRLRCVKELVYAEEVYNECLKNLLEFYAEPLRYVHLLTNFEYVIHSKHYIVVW